MNLYQLFCSVLYLCFVTTVSCINIEENAYTGVSISFSDQIKERDFKFEKLKNAFQKSSEILYHATKNRAYFGEFIIIVPSQWSGSGFCAEFTEIPPKKVNIYVSNLSEDLKAQNSKGCGQEGDIIYMPLKWVEGNIEDLAIRFVQEWSIYRYGVFEEIPFENGACYAISDEKWSPVGCYDKEIETEVTMLEDGLPSCEPLSEDKLKELKSSLMFKTNKSKALNFCDGSKDFPHNPVMPTLHNNLCEGKTVWSVIENSNDFKHGKNLPNKLSLPLSPSFKCYREPSIELTFAIQISSTSDITLVVQELRYTLYRFIKNLIPKKSRLNLVTFSDSSDITAVTLSIEEDDQLFKILNKHVVTTKKGTNACLICGMEKALNASYFESRLSPIVILIAMESALIGQKVSQLVETIQNYPNIQLHLAFIEDTEADVVPTDLVNAVRSTGGFLHSLPKPYRMEITDTLVPNVLLYEQMNVILSAVVKSPLEVDDKIIVVHEVTYKNGSTITDTFSTPSVTRGRLVYMMHCDLKGQIGRGPNCSLWDEEYLTSFKCGQVTDLSDRTPKTWTYKFDLREGVNRPICSALAILYRHSSYVDDISLRGWLNQYTITPEKNALIIYAEISGAYQRNTVEVIAQIIGPGMDTPAEIELRDNGNGDPDIKSGDGIYSRYFVSFKEKGTHVVTVTVKIAKVKNSNSDASDVEPERIQRKVIGSFSVAAKLPAMDILPPNRVADLKVFRIDHANSNSTVTLQWTAPGNDYDFGKATKYEIKSATHPANLMDIYFDTEECTLLNPTPTPQNSGEKEIFSYTFSGDDQDSIYYVGLRAKDARNNRAKISNIVQIFLKWTKVTIPEVTTGITATNNESITDDMNVTSTVYSTTPDYNATTVKWEIAWENILSDTKFIIILSSAGGILLLLIIINVIICCCCRRKKNKPKTVSKKNSLRPPHNTNIAYQHESQSYVSESDLSVSLQNLNDTNQYSTSEGSPRYSYYTSKTIAEKTKSQSNTELGFKLVETLPTNTTRSLARYARRFSENDRESNPPVAQPQKPANNNEAPVVYSLGNV